MGEKPKRCEKDFDEFKKSLGLYEPNLKEITKKFKIKEKYPYSCFYCPWSFFETEEEKYKVSYMFSDGRIFEILKNRIVYRCKDPKRQYLIATDR